METVARFLGIALLAYVTPGPDWFVVMGHAAVSRRRGVVAALGVLSGLVVHMTAAAIGVAALLLASAEAFTALKLIGAAYLIFLGAKALIRARRLSHAGLETPKNSEPPKPLRAVYRSSLLANVMNPKAALFFIAVLPQFVDSAAAVAPQVFFLGVLDIGLGLAWWAVFIVAITQVKHLLGMRRSRVVLDRVSGISLLGLGGVLTFTSRPQTV
jgi:threonine/homoserine/homoserine lactone efflux protein